MAVFHELDFNQFLNPKAARSRTGILAFPKKDFKNLGSLKKLVVVVEMKASLTEVQESQK